jgi:hypothetical protein
MKARTLIVYVAACFLCMAGSALAQKAAGGGGKPVPCTNPSLAVTIVPIDSSTITGDGKGATYTNGQYGVVNTVINLCQSGGTSPNYDATLGLGGSQRSMGFTCPSAIAGSIIDGPSPVWANGAMFQTQPWIQIHNILHGRMHGLSTFTTRMIVGYVKGPGDSKYYDLRIQNDNVDAVQTELVLNTNSPSETATVTVQDVRGTCHDYPQTGTKDSWVVTVDQPFIGTLITMDKNKTHSGQYHMPMQFGIDVLACPRCGGRFRLIALIDEASVIERILRHLHLPTEVPTPRPGRAPPLLGACSFNQDTDVAVFNSYA